MKICFYVYLNPNVNSSEMTDTPFMYVCVHVYACMYEAKFEEPGASPHFMYVCFYVCISEAMREAYIHT